MQLKIGASDAGGTEQASHDMLKNTPSNIRRLASEIDQFEGRQKYVANTRSPSDGGDVRWYFCKVPLGVNELAASVPRTEIVGKGEYFRFGMRDSLAIEASFLQREDELLSVWWQEYAECSEGPKAQPNVLSKSKSSSESHVSVQLYANEEERVGVPVKGGLYEVDLSKRHSFPVYWSGDYRRVLRGHWFALKGGLDWLPIREDVSEQLEYAYRCQVWHRRTFQLSGLFAARVDLQGPTPGLYSLFTGEDDTWEAWLNVDASGISSVVGFGGSGIKLRRGYAKSQAQKPTQDEIRQRKEEEMDDYCSQVPVGHLVFMIHGIGQRLEKSNLVDDVGEFRHLASTLAERHLTSHQRGKQRVLFIPCQWRKGLTLSGEKSVEKITLDGVRGLRTMLGATVHDVLYYMSPIYCQDIIDSVSNQLNKLYLKFLRRNPGYDGKVSLYGHSLGSVLSYDILCHQENLYSPFPMEWMYKAQKGSDSPSPIRGNLSSDCNPVSNLEDKSETLSINNPVDNTLFGPPTILSDSDESSTIIDENRDEHQKESYKSEIVQCDSKNEEYISDNDKDETVKLLREEIDLPKDKIKEFEAESSGKGISAQKSAEKHITVNLHRDQDSLKSYTPEIRYTKLEFKVDTFFAVGSPLGVFLCLRNVRIGIGRGKQYWEEDKIKEEIPACRQMFNIFHPFDPVAYRIEPLVCKEFQHKRPVIVPYHKGGKRLYVGFQEFREGLASRSQAMMYRLSSVRVKILTLCESGSNDGRDEESGNTQEKEERSYGSIMMERLTGSEEGRIDHMLQDKTFRHPYLSAIGSHTNYWRDPDTCLFILRHLYRDTREEPFSPTEQIEGSSKDANSLIADEELPLTFADMDSIRNFSQKAKKIMKS